MHQRTRRGHHESALLCALELDLSSITERFAALTDHQKSRLIDESHGGQLFVGVAGDIAVCVVRRPGEALSKALVAADGSVIARYAYLPDRDRWGFPWMIQDYKQGDDKPYPARVVAPLSADLTAAQEAALARAERASGRVLDGIGMQGEELVLLIPDEQGFVIERRILPNGSVREYAPV